MIRFLFLQTLQRDSYPSLPGGNWQKSDSGFGTLQDVQVRLIMQ